jgi:hypothetical protein
MSTTNVNGPRTWIGFSDKTKSKQLRKFESPEVKLPIGSFKTNSKISFKNSGS